MSPFYSRIRYAVCTSIYSINNTSLFILVVSNSKANQNQMNNNNQAPKPPPKKSVSMRDESMPDVGREVWVNLEKQFLSEKEF